MAVRRQPIPFGKYYLLDRINIGGMAEVWRAKTFGEQGFEKLVAIKRILPNIAEDDEFITMFIDEAKITVQLTHANVAQVFDLGKIGDSYFIAMEYVAGKDFRAIFDRCRKKGEPAPIPMVCFMVAKMCEGLDYAHRKKDPAGNELHIVHRDVSPQNVLVSFEGECKVIDFGIAKAANKATKTQAGILKGKFGYMSPEQVRGLPLDQRSDVFAAGVVLYEMLTGERLFVGDSDFSVLEKVRQVDILPPTKYNRRIPEGLEKIVLKALAKDVDERYQWASDLGDALQRFLLVSDTIFSRKDLAQYLKSTFAEDVEKEKVRQAEYAEIKLPPGMAAMAGLAGGANMRMTAAVPRQPSAPPAARPPVPTAPAVAPRQGTGRPAPPAPRDAQVEVTAPEVREHTVIDGDDVFADAGARRPARPAPPVDDIGGMLDEQLLSEAPSGNGAVALAPQSAAPAAAPHRLRTSGAMPAMRPPTGRPLPPNLGEPVRPGPPVPVVAARPPPGAHPPPPAYKPRLPELEHVQPGSSSKLKWVLIGAWTFGLALVLAVVGLVILGGSGFLLVDYEPADARVFVDGVEVCPSAPCAASAIKAGTHQMEIRKEKYKTYAQVIEVPRNDTFRGGKVKLEPLVSNVSFLLASDPPDAEISVDGQVVRELGKPGLFRGQLKIGEAHEVVVTKPGFAAWRKTITPPNAEKPIDEFVQLQSQAKTITFTSKPDKAKVLLDDKLVGTTPLSVEGVDTGVPHTVVFQKPCYKDATATLLPGSPSTEIDKKLERKPGCP